MSTHEGESRSEMLHRNLTGAEIHQNIYKFHNYDIDAVQADMHQLVIHDSFKKLARQSTPLWLGVTAFSAYNITRLPVLSAQGKIAALGGCAYGLWMTYQAQTM